MFRLTFRLIVASAMVLGWAVSASADTITFEGVPQGWVPDIGGVTVYSEGGWKLTGGMPGSPGYGAMWIAAPPTGGCAQGGCYTNGTNVLVSGGAYYGNTLTAIDGAAFDFDSFDLSYAFYSYSGAIRFDALGYSGGIQTHSYTTYLTEASQGFFPVVLNWKNVDAVYFDSSENSYNSWYGMDNLSINAVPEPASLLLLGAGLAGLARVARRRR